jgi:hypothetical protein
MQLPSSMQKSGKTYNKRPNSVQNLAILLRDVKFGVKTDNIAPFVIRFKEISVNLPLR